ncbi:hypothetical protein [Candidatus Poriferisocius sp.]|uniref:hypothetical protein n=1 Tax=Candidatus Poriferisocius sp. TaxID=3101276 RepID=UPI003B02B1F7
MMIALIGLVLVASACGEGSDNSAGSSPGHATDSGALVSVMRSIGESLDYGLHDSPAILGDKASLTVIGTVADVADGRVFGVGETRDTEPAFLNLTLTVKVESVLGGDESLVQDGLVYIEIARTKELPVETFQRAVPVNQRLVLFLDDYTEGLTPFRVVEKASSIPDGAPVLSPYADGFLIEDVSSGELIGGFDHLDELPPAWKEGTGTVDSFKAEHFSGGELAE